MYRNNLHSSIEGHHFPKLITAMENFNNQTLQQLIQSLKESTKSANENTKQLKLLRKKLKSTKKYIKKFMKKRLAEQDNAEDDSFPADFDDDIEEMVAVANAIEAEYQRKQTERVNNLRHLYGNANNTEPISCIRTHIHY
ncbi:hypothetical protein MBANPS3_009955 [Mucor bainieri]